MPSESNHIGFKVLVSEDKLSATLYRTEQGGSALLTAETLHALLEDAGVVFGRKPAAEVVAEAGRSSFHSMVVAEGTKPADGVDGRLEIVARNLQVEKSPGAEKRVDFHELGWIRNVLKGETLAILHLPVPGKPGVSVLGAQLPGREGKHAEVIVGHHVGRDDNGIQRLVALEDGNFVVRRDGTLEIDKEVTIRGDVDYSTGDVDFVGSVVVTGDVKSGFRVKARKSIEVMGNVEDARVESGGHVTIRKGFIGQGKGAVVAEGNVQIQHVRNQTVNSGAVITVEREAICARLHARDTIKSPCAVFVGCILEAGNGVDVLNLGNGDEGQARVRVGKRAILLERIKTIEKELGQIDKQLADIQNGLYRIARLELDHGGLTQEQQQTHVRLRSLQAELQNGRVLRTREQEQLTNDLTDDEQARVIVRDTLFANVIVELNGVKKLFQQGLREVVLSECSGKIVEQALD